MAKSNRERQIMIGAGVAIVALALNYLVYEPYNAALEKADKDKIAQQDILNKSMAVLKRERDLRKALANLQARGLKDDNSQAESQVFGVVLDAADTSRVNVTSIKSDKVTAGGNFQELDYSVTGTGSTAQLAKMLWAFETAPVPLRVKEMVITARKDATDDLQLQMKIATLASTVGSAPAPSAAPAPTNDADTGGL